MYMESYFYDNGCKIDMGRGTPRRDILPQLFDYVYSDPKVLLNLGIFNCWKRQFTLEKQILRKIV